MNLTVARYLAGPLQLEIQSRYTAEARDALSGTNETVIAIDLNASPFLKIGLSTATMIMRRLLSVNGGNALGKPAAIHAHPV